MFICLRLGNRQTLPRALSLQILPGQRVKEATKNLNNNWIWTQNSADNLTLWGAHSHLDPEGGNSFPGVHLGERPHPFMLLTLTIPTHTHTHPITVTAEFSFKEKNSEIQLLRMTRVDFYFLSSSTWSEAHAKTPAFSTQGQLPGPVLLLTHPIPLGRRACWGHRPCCSPLCHRLPHTSAWCLLTE